MRHPCRELERHIESGAEHLPDALRAHLTACARCQRAWRLHAAYRRALQAARREPTPACELPWSRVQAQIAARAVSRRPARWLSPALAWGTAIVVALAIGAALFPTMTQPRGKTHARATHEHLMPAPADMAHAEALDADAPAQAIARAENAPRAPATTIVAQATPRMHESARLQSPEAKSPPPPMRARGSAAEANNIPESDPMMRARAVPHEDAAFVMGQAMAGGTPDFGYEQAFAIASLPLTPFGVGDQSTGVEYLPIRYGTSSYEGSHHEAVIGSF